MIITTLTDNNAATGSGCGSEHGFSTLIEYNGSTILFDTGKSDLFIKNANLLHKDLSHVDTLVISHGHYDHGGGVKDLLDTYDYNHLTLYTGQGFMKRKFVVEEGKERELGVNFDRHYLNTKGVIWKAICQETLMIKPGFFLVSCFKHLKEEHVNRRFLIEDENGVRIDHFTDEICLVIDSPKGLVMIVGCSHPGILSMIESVSERFSRPLYALLGGIHLYDSDEQRRTRVLDSLIAMDIPMLGVSHCTGTDAESYLNEHCPNYFLNNAGTITTI